MLIRPSSSQPRLVRSTVVLLENSITVRITEEYKRMEVITQQLYVPNYIEGGWYTHQTSKTVPPQTMIDPPSPSTVPTWYAGSMAFISMTPNFQPPVGVKLSESRLPTQCYSFQSSTLQFLYSLAKARRAVRWRAVSNGTLVGRRLPNLIR
ncbi:hypothetical protein TNCV_740801 [Trichonephila clavipes]|nr:hypothetical protein TNCV_740801 [Trichonephila clavipes]